MKKYSLKEAVRLDFDAYVKELGTLANAFDEGELETAIISTAEACHYANRAYAIAIKDKKISGRWNEVDDDMKDSAVFGVLNTLRGAQPIDNHINWLRVKAEQGWVYGEERDDAKKTHPCMVSYSELPQAQRTKDTIFINIVTMVAPFSLTQNMRRERIKREALGALSEANAESVSSDKN